MRTGALLAISGLFATAITGKTVVFFGDALASGELSPEVQAASAVAHSASDPAQQDGSQVLDVNDEPSRHNSIVCEENTSELAKKLKVSIAKNSTLKVELENRAALLELTEQRVAERIQALEDAQQKLSGSLSALDRASTDDITALVRMYQAMKPSQAGAIFNEMEPSFASGFLTRMNAESAALILANMDAEKAYTVSVVIAGTAAKLKQY